MWNVMLTQLIHKLVTSFGEIIVNLLSLKAVIYCLDAKVDISSSSCLMIE